MSKLRVWHIPQVPMKPFFVDVESVADGVRVMDALADYDLFQFDNNIKPDYCNASGMHVWDESLTEQDLVDMELNDRWVDWFIEVGDDYFDDPREYLESISESA